MATITTTTPEIAAPTLILTPIPELPNHIIEYILNLAELPLPIRLTFIDYGFYLTPSDLPYENPIEYELHHNFIYQLKKYAQYRAKKEEHDKKPYLKKHNDIYKLMEVPIMDFEISIIEYKNEFIFGFERTILDYETGDMHIFRKISCNLHTGELL